jgi:superfamily II DNA or RNA helicase
VATVQSLDVMKKGSQKKFSQFLNGFRVIMFDECHHASAKTWYTAGTWAHNAYYRFGFSGTPMDREEIDSMKLMAVVGQTIYKRKTQEAIEDGDLCPIEMEMLDNEEESVGFTWQDIYRRGIVNSRVRNDMIADLAVENYKAGRKVLILVRIIEHGDNLKAKLEGWPVVFLHGKHSQEQREEAISWFEQGKGILIASGIFDEGIDIPEINVLIVASGGKSDVKTIQRIGRGLRKKGEGIHLKAYDFIDGSEYIFDHSQRRKEIYKREGYLD